MPPTGRLNATVLLQTGALGFLASGPMKLRLPEIYQPIGGGRKRTDGASIHHRRGGRACSYPINRSPSLVYRREGGYDTRNADGPYGGPVLAGARSFVVPGSSCGAPEGSVYSYDGSIVSNAALVPAASGSIDAFATNSTHLILDINGYFAP